MMYNMMKLCKDCIVRYSIHTPYVYEWRCYFLELANALLVNLVHHGRETWDLY